MVLSVVAVMIVMVVVVAVAMVLQLLSVLFSASVDSVPVRQEEPVSHPGQVQSPDGRCLGRGVCIDEARCRAVCPRGILETGPARVSVQVLSTPKTPWSLQPLVSSPFALYER